MNSGRFLCSMEPPDAADGERRNVSPTETTDAAKTDSTNKKVSSGRFRLRSRPLKLPARPSCRSSATRRVRGCRAFAPDTCRLPSFRQRFGDGLKNDVIEALAPRYFRKEAEKQGLIPASQPRITDLHFHDGEPCASRPVSKSSPKFRVEATRIFRADKPEIAITDEEVEQALSNLARAASHLRRRGRTRPGARRLRPGVHGRTSQRWQRR